MTLVTAPQYTVRAPTAQKSDKNAQPEGNLKKTVRSKAAQGPQHPIRIPDFARTIDIDNHAGKKKKLPSGPRMTQVLIDTTEIKRLDTKRNEPWGTEEARLEAERAISLHMFQVYQTAMSAFSHHPNWKFVYTMLAIGIYYSQFRWKRPGDDLLKQIPVSCSKLMKGPHKPGELDILEIRFKKAIKECNARTMPEVLVWNQPIVTFQDNENIASSEAIITFSPSFLWSMRQPLKPHHQIKLTRSWLSGPYKRPEEIDNDSLVS